MSAVTRKTRIIDVLYNASNNELVRTKTLVKNCIISIDCTPFRTWYEAHYALPLGKKKGAKLVRVDDHSQHSVCILNKWKGACSIGLFASTVAPQNCG